MANKKLFGSSLPSSSHKNGGVGGIVPKGPRILHQDGASLDHHTPGNPVSELQAVRSSRTSTSSPPLSILRTPGAPMTPIPGSDPECSSTRPQGQSLGSALSSRTRIKCRSSQQEDPETLLDLILESQGQRLNDQRASLSLLHDPGSGSLCGACNPNQLHRPSLDFYYMLINFQLQKCRNDEAEI
ncbi:uncharacterized protein LOC115049236 isoform X2 [Echeneis naucrates]|uniref:uncharacterized protein LOC115049236 isoform X2 n=1 Tax=Echeneis naucrates TaxID=173247 RepID=UPI0011144CF0|nr:uncharacterized protein LOC115049236 isoform X2 [Echeneis naucrates]